MRRGLLTLLFSLSFGLFAENPVGLAAPRFSDATPPLAEGRGASASALKPYFEENLGQLDRADIRFFFRSAGLAIGFAEGKVLFHELEPPDLTNNPGKGTSGTMYSLEVGDGTSSPLGEMPLSSRSHYLLGRVSSKWIRGARHFDRILYRAVYPGIDLVFFFDEEHQLTYEFLVEPGADPTIIELRFRGIDGVEPLGPSAMKISTGQGEIQDGRLLCYQDIEGERQAVESAFRKTGSDSYRVDLLEPYDRSRSLIIDPTLRFSTYWGSGGANNRTVVIDGLGNIYMSGGTSSTDWPTTPGAYDRTHSGGPWSDVTVAKFDPSGRNLWSTYIGGRSEDYAYVSAVNENGELYVSGRAGEGFPTTPGAFDSSFNGGQGGGPHAPTDAFVLKLSADGDQLLYSTYIGGNADENGRAIHLLASGDLLVAGGNTSSTNLPTTAGVYKRNLGGARDSWVAKVSADGRSLDFLTYFGPDNDTRADETIRALGIDAGGNIWLGGTTNGTDLTATPDAFQKTPGGGRSDAYIAKLSPDGRQLVYFSWLGGRGFDEIETEGVSDASGNFFVAGSTASTDFPTTPGAFQRNLKGGGGTFDGDGWVAKINNDGSLAFATLFGGSRQGPEAFFGPVVDNSGNVYATGRFLSDDCPVTPDAFQPMKADKGRNTQDAFLAAFSPDGRELLYGSYFGGTGKDHGRHLAIHPDGSTVVVITESNSQNFPLHRPSQVSPAGATLLKLDVGDLSGIPVSRFESGFEVPDFGDWHSRFCPACNSVVGHLEHRQSLFPQSSWYESDSAAKHRAVISGPKNTDFDLVLRWWNGAQWIPVASASNPSSSEEVTYQGGPGRYRWEVRSNEGSGLFELMIDRVGAGLGPINSLEQTPAAKRRGRFGVLSRYELGTKNKDYLTFSLPTMAKRVLASFWINPRGDLDLKGKKTRILELREGRKARVRLSLLPPENRGQPTLLSVEVKSAQGGWLAPIVEVLPSERWTKVGLDWQSSSSATVADGSIRVTTGKNNNHEISKIQNDRHRVDDIRFGQVLKRNKGTSGTVFFDKFTSSWET